MDKSKFKPDVDYTADIPPYDYIRNKNKLISSEVYRRNCHREVTAAPYSEPKVDFRHAIKCNLISSDGKFLHTSLLGKVSITLDSINGDDITWLIVSPIESNGNFAIFNKWTEHFLSCDCNFIIADRPWVLEYEKWYIQLKNGENDLLKYLTSNQIALNQITLNRTVKDHEIIIFSKEDGVKYFQIDNGECVLSPIFNNEYWTLRLV